MKKKWYEIKALSEDEAEVWIYAEIGEDWWGDGSSVSARDFAKELAAVKAPHIALHLNSPGGEVSDGQAIYNVLKNHPATVTTHIDGLAASIASVIALAGEHVVMAENALYMIHEPWGGTRGNAAEMRKYADVLDQFGKTMRDVYVAKTGSTIEDIAAAMAEETWYTAAEALAAGFVDEVDENLKAAACASFDPRALGYKRVPLELVEELTGEAPAATEPPTPEPTADAADGSSDAPRTLTLRTVELLTQIRNGGTR